MAASKSSHVHEQSCHIEETGLGPGSEDVTHKEVTGISWKNWLNLVAFVVNIVATWVGSLVGKYRIGELSSKYRSLVNPASWTFAVWFAIFAWEGVFVYAQFSPRFRQSVTVLRVSPWWWAACAFQGAWTPVFTQDWITPALVLMFGILGSLLGIAWRTDGLQISWEEYFYLRAPLSLQLGWVISATIVSVNQQADALKASQDTLLALAILSYVIVVAVVTAFTLAVKSPDPILGFVAAWSFAGIFTSLDDPVKLNNPTRHNPIIWDEQTLNGLKIGALAVCLFSGAISALAGALKFRVASRNGSPIEDKRHTSVSASD